MKEEQVTPDHAGTTTVRMEMFLTPDQISTLFKSISLTHHSILTSREAASYLRVSQHTVEDMAKSSEIAAFRVDGKWRFPKAGLDEWVSLQLSRKEAC